MDRKDFLAWHGDFVKRFAAKGDTYGGSSTSYKPKDMDEWLDLVEKNHENLRKKLGGVSRTFKIGIKDAQPTAAPFQQVYDIMVQVCRIMPDYFNKYYLSHEQFQQPKLASQKNISGTKHILGYADRSKLEADKRKELEKLTEQLGQLWKQTCKAPKGEGYITLTTDPKAYCLIGRLKCCGYSCFGQGNFNSDKKYALGIHKDSFIVFAHPDEQLKTNDENDNNVVARALGVMTGKNMSFMHTLNHHPYFYGYRDEKPLKLSANSTQMIEVAKEFYESDKIDVQSNKICLTHGINYGAYTGYTYFDKEKNKPLERTKNVKIDWRYSKEAHPNGDGYGKWDETPNDKDEE